MKLAPSILSCDFGRLREEIQAAEAGGADWIHVDVMDGHFVPNITIGPRITEVVRDATDLPVDVHLMIEAPERYLEHFVDAGADVVTVHQEVSPHLHRTLTRIRDLGALAGVALNPSTPVDSVASVVPVLDLLLIMSVNPGFGGQTFIEASVDRVRTARWMLDAAGSDAALEVDGGVDAGNVAILAAAGATVLVAGSAVYGHADGAAGGLRSLRDGLAG
ncbi:MAG: ribulose-phosphate 3-epimerase [Longimicrobiales bacterium]